MVSILGYLIPGIGPADSCEVHVFFLVGVRRLFRMYGCWMWVFQVVLLLQGFGGLGGLNKTVKVITQNASLPKVLLGMYFSRAPCRKECLKGASDMEEPTLA